jgi:intracellular septation protein
MQLLLEYLPLAAFGVAWKFFGIYVATATLMVGMTLSVVLLRLRSGKFPPLLTASTALVLVFGAATLILRDIRFIQWKPSIFLWLLALAFLFSSFMGREPLAQKLMQSALGDATVERSDWLKVNAAWVVFGLVTGIANLLVAYNTSEATWVKTKLFGLTAAMLLFLVGQALWLNSRVKPRT